MFTTLAFIALAQSNADADLTLVALDAAVGSLPRPRVEVQQPPSSAEPAASPVRPPPPAHVSSTFSPWDTAPRYAAPGTDTYNTETNGHGYLSNPTNGANPDAEAERGYWRRLETVEVGLVSEKEGWFLQKYRVVSDKRPDALSRRYSDFVWLHHTLLQRYVSSCRNTHRMFLADPQPFRLLPVLPPKRLNPDVVFLEQRRWVL